MSNTPISDGNRMHPVSERGIIRTSSGVLDADGAFVPYIVACELERQLSNWKRACEIAYMEVRRLRYKL